jgi:hypothetical protein
MDETSGHSADRMTVRLLHQILTVMMQDHPEAAEVTVDVEVQTGSTWRSRKRSPLTGAGWGRYRGAITEVTLRTRIS